MKNITYISELCLPSNSGYAQHVLKICDAFSKKFNTNLFVISNNRYFRNFKKEYLLKKILRSPLTQKTKKIILLQEYSFHFIFLKILIKTH